METIAAIRTLVSAVLLAGLPLSLASSLLAPYQAAVYDAQNGMGLGNGIVYDGTQYVNASDNSYAVTAGQAGSPTWVQANWSLSIPAGAKVLDAMLALEHRQDVSDQITVDVGANNGTGWAWGICGFPPLGVADTDVFSYCNLTQYVTQNVSLLQVYLNITYSSGTKRESVDFLNLNYTYIMPANLSGQVSTSEPANGSILNANVSFDIIGDYNLSCSGSGGTECGFAEVYAEYCPGTGCTDFRRITDYTYIHNVTQNGISCGYMQAGGNCSGTLNVSAVSAAGKYRLRVSAHSYSNDVYRQANAITAYAMVITPWTPPYSAVCYDPVGGHGINDCTAEVNAQDLSYAEMRYNPDNQPGWSNANFSFTLPVDSVIENVSMRISHVEDNTPYQNGTAYFWNGTAWQAFCTLGMAVEDHTNTCDLPLSQFPSESTLRDVLLRFEFNTSLGTSTGFLDYLGMRVQYRTPFAAVLNGSVALYLPGDRWIITPNTDFDITGSYSLSCAGPPGVECLITRVFPEFCFGEGCTDFRRVDNTTNVYSLGANEVNCGFLTVGQNCSGNISVAAQANAGKYAFRLRANSYAGDLFSGRSTVTFPGNIFTSCTPLYSGVCNSPSGTGVYDCTSEVRNRDNVYATLKYTPTNQPAWMNANISFWLARNAYIMNVSSDLTHRIETPDKQTGSEFTWNVTGWSKVCGLGMISYDHTDRCELFLSLFQKASDLDNIRNRVEYNASVGTRRSWVDYTCVRTYYRVPLLYTDRTEYSVGGSLGIMGDYWAYDGILNLSIYDDAGNLAHSALVSTNGSGYFDHYWAIGNATPGQEMIFFMINVTDTATPWHTDAMPFGIRGCEAYVEDIYVPCSLQCPAYTNYTISLMHFEEDELLVSRFKVCHLA